MQELAHEVGYSCDLRVYSMGSQTVIASINTPSGIGFNVRTGAEIAVAPSASGRVLVAFQTAETTELRIKESLEGLPAAEVKAFRKEVHEVTVKGFASIKSRQYEGVHAISFPILDIERHAVAALTVPMVPRVDSAPTMSRTQVEEKLRESAGLLTSLIS
jgi:DNA-binding IclR family transcriptional regulator